MFALFYASPISSEPLRVAPTGTAPITWLRRYHLFTGKATNESDVYSFEILVLEVLRGTSPLDPNAHELDEEIEFRIPTRVKNVGQIA